MASNPIGAGLTPERVDQGVDYGGSGPLYALGAGTIVNLHNPGWPGGNFLVLKLDQPINGQQYVYYAEDIAPLVSLGQKVLSGAHIANATGGPSGIEVGWASSNLGSAAATGFTGSNSTTLGADFSSLIKSLGGKPGILQNQVSGTIQGIQGNVPGVSPAGFVGSAAITPGGQTTTPATPSSTGLPSLLSGAEGLLRDVATALDYFFGMFGRGQGWRLVFTVASGVSLILSYKILAAAGVVPGVSVPKAVPL